MSSDLVSGSSCGRSRLSFPAIDMSSVSTSALLSHSPTFSVGLIPMFEPRRAAAAWEEALVNEVFGSVILALLRGRSGDV